MCGWEFFPNRKGMVSGIIVGGFGFGTFIFGFISTALVNPDNVEPFQVPNGDVLYPFEIASRTPKMLRELCAMWIVLSAIGIIFIDRNPSFVRKERE